MIENRFGYDAQLPEKFRTIFMWLCQDVASLQSKWDLYMELYGKDASTDLLSELAPLSFNVIEDSMRHAMTMAICRLSDPVETFGHENLSLATLVKNCPDIAGLETMLVKFQNACEIVGVYRNKRIGHSDLHARIRPRDNPLPDIGREQIDLILKLASDILNTVIRRFDNAELRFQSTAKGGGNELMYWLNAAKEHRSRV